MFVAFFFLQKVPFFLVQSLVSCPSISERNVLADITKIIEKNRMIKRKDNFIRKMVVDGLVAVGYDASICESRWEKTPSVPAGKHTISITPHILLGFLA